MKLCIFSPDKLKEKKQFSISFLPWLFYSRKKKFFALSEFHLTFPPFFLIKDARGNIPFPFESVMSQEVKKAPWGLEQRSSALFRQVDITKGAESFWLLGSFDSLWWQHRINKCIWPFYWQTYFTLASFITLGKRFTFGDACIKVSGEQLASMCISANGYYK